MSSRSRRLRRAHCCQAHCWIASLALALSLLVGSPRPCAASPDPALDSGVDAAASVELEGIWPAPQNTLPRPSLTRQLPLVTLAALAYALLVAAKARAVQRAARQRSSQVRALLGGHSATRDAVAGALLLGASGAVLWLDAPLLGALLLLIVLALATHRPPISEMRLRGPGQWQPLGAAALEPLPTPALPGAWLDVGRPQGFLLLLASMAALFAIAIRLFESSPYHGACLLLGSAALLPVFCTGRAAELPEPDLAESRRFLRGVFQAMGGAPDLVLLPLGRFCTGASELDELRLAIHPAQALPGLIGIELGLEFRPVLTGQSAGPVLVIRAADGSPYQRALPRELTWTRGRTAEERAALVRPKLPNVALTVGLIRELTALASVNTHEQGANANSEHGAELRADPRRPRGASGRRAPPAP